VATNPPTRRPIWLGWMFAAVSFALLCVLAYFNTPYFSEKSELGGVVVFLVALLIAIVCSWGW
jgi:amino acid transporter